MSAALSLATLWPETEEFLDRLREVFDRSPQALDFVGGNLLLVVFDKGAWTVRTRGPQPGLLYGATEDLVHFTLACEEFVLAELLDPTCEPNLAQYVLEGALIVEGDMQVFERLLRVAAPSARALAVRCA